MNNPDIHWTEECSNCYRRGINPYIHWTEECSYCYKRGICEYEDDTRDFRKALSILHNGAKYVFGTINFKCDYFKLDENKFNRHHIGVTNGTNS